MQLLFCAAMAMGLPTQATLKLAMAVCRAVQNKLRTELGGQSGTAHRMPFKAKGMWQRTYDRKRFKSKRSESQANHLFLSKSSHILSWKEREMYFGN